MALVGAFLALPALAPAAQPTEGAPDASDKNDTSTERSAPAPATPSAPDTGSAAPAEPPKAVRVEGEKPITKKALESPQQTTPAATEPSGTPTTAATATRTRSTSRGGTSRRDGVRGNRGGATRGTARADRVRALNAADAAERREAREDARAERARRQAERRRAAERRAGDAPSQAEEDEANTSLAILSRTADDVVEVVPATVWLAMTGMGALVLLLMLRSWVYERRRTCALRDTYRATVHSLAVAIEAKDHTTGGHIERVRDLGLLLARELEVADVDDPQMAYGFLLHDVGKLSVPDAILRHPGRLDSDGWAILRRHPEEGVRILSAVPFLGRAIDVVRHHHERWDGKGYPDGLGGREIPLWARIFSVVDALDAMTAERPYRAAMSYDDALAEIRRHAGTQFDPSVVTALEQIGRDQIERLLEPVQRTLSMNGNGVPLAELETLPERVENQPVSA